MNESGWEQKLIPIERGDIFVIGPYLFTCLGWKNGRILASRREWWKQQGWYIIEYSFSIDVALGSDFKIISRAKEEA
jgi:hypothetical protein